MRDGRRWSKEKKDYHGYYTRPLGWKEVEEKFRRLTDRHIDPKRQDTIVQLCQTLENVSIGRLVPLLLG
jgi:2-methylcitrate dehydratase PrpD